MAGPCEQGCAETRIELRDCEGGRLIERVNTPGIEWLWSRSQSIPSECSLIGTAEACAAVIELARDWDTDLWVFRRGRPMWQGPITRILNNEPEGFVEITASDLAVLFGRRRFDEPETFSGSAINVMLKLLLAADRIDSVGLQPIVLSPDNLGPDISIDVTAGSLVSTAIERLRTSIWWSVAAGTIYISAIGEHPIGPIVDRSWFDRRLLTTERNGRQRVNDLALIDQTGTQRAQWPPNGWSPDVDPCRLLQGAVVDETSGTKEDGQLAARSVYEELRYSQLDIFAQDLPLSTDAQLCPDDTIAGTRFPVRLGDQITQGDLTTLAVEGQGPNETGTFIALGRTVAPLSLILG